MIITLLQSLYTETEKYHLNFAMSSVAIICNVNILFRLATIIHKLINFQNSKCLQKNYS